jgi:hypothetical protein
MTSSLKIPLFIIRGKFPPFSFLKSINKKLYFATIDYNSLLQNAKHSSLTFLRFFQFLCGKFYFVSHNKQNEKKNQEKINKMKKFKKFRSECFFWDVLFQELSKFPFSNCQNFPFQTVKISFFKLSKFPAYPSPFFSLFLREK